MGDAEPDNEQIELKRELADLNAAADKFLNLPSAANGQDARFDLYVKASRFLWTVRGPMDMTFSHYENIANMGAIRTLLEAGVFHAIPTGGGSISAKQISAKTGVDREIIVRLMRALTPFGPFRETGEEQYAHTPFSEIYLTPQVAAMWTLVVDEYLPSLLRNHEYLRQHDWKNKITLRDNPYTHANNCKGQTMFEYISGIPDRSTRFNEAMVTQDDGQLVIDMYPFEEELKSEAEDGRATIIDVGGGRGHILRQIRKLAPNLKGRFILQDQAQVIAENGKGLEADGFEAMAHDFFTPQPVKGALAYYMRRCLHDWPDEPEARQILESLAVSMDREKSRVLITEFIVPDVGAGMLTAWMDQCIMAFGGVERTEKDFARLLDSAGLRLVKVWRAPVTPVGVVEARLK